MQNTNFILQPIGVNH